MTTKRTHFPQPAPGRITKRNPFPKPAAGPDYETNPISFSLRTNKLESQKHPRAVSAIGSFGEIAIRNRKPPDDDPVNGPPRSESSECPQINRAEDCRGQGPASAAQCRQATALSSQGLRPRRGFRLSAGPRSGEGRFHPSGPARGVGRASRMARARSGIDLCQVQEFAQRGRFRRPRGRSAGKQDQQARRRGSCVPARTPIPARVVRKAFSSSPRRDPTGLRPALAGAPPESRKPAHLGRGPQRSLGLRHARRPQHPSRMFLTRSSLPTCDGPTLLALARLGNRGIGSRYGGPTIEPNLKLSSTSTLPRRAWGFRHLRAPAIPPAALRAGPPGGSSGGAEGRAEIQAKANPHGHRRGLPSPGSNRFVERAPPTPEAVSGAETHADAHSPTPSEPAGPRVRLPTGLTGIHRVPRQGPPANFGTSYPGFRSCLPPSPPRPPPNRHARACVEGSKVAERGRRLGWKTKGDFLSRIRVEKVGWLGVRPRTPGSGRAGVRKRPPSHPEQPSNRRIVPSERLNRMENGAPAPTAGLRSIPTQPYGTSPSIRSKKPALARPAPNEPIGRLGLMMFTIWFDCTSVTSGKGIASVEGGISTRLGTSRGPAAQDQERPGFVAPVSVQNDFRHEAFERRGRRGAHWRSRGVVFRIKSRFPLDEPLSNARRPPASAWSEGFAFS